MRRCARTGMKRSGSDIESRIPVGRRQHQQHRVPRLQRHARDGDGLRHETPCVLHRRIVPRRLLDDGMQAVACACDSAQRGLSQQGDEAVAQEARRRVAGLRQQPDQVGEQGARERSTYRAVRKHGRKQRAVPRRRARGQGLEAGHQSVGCAAGALQLRLGRQRREARDKVTHPQLDLRQCLGRKAEQVGDRLDGHGKQGVRQRLLLGHLPCDLQRGGMRGVQIQPGQRALQCRLVRGMRRTVVHSHQVAEHLARRAAGNHARHRFCNRAHPQGARCEQQRFDDFGAARNPQAQAFVPCERWPGTQGFVEGIGIGVRDGRDRIGGHGWERKARIHAAQCATAAAGTLRPRTKCRLHRRLTMKG